MDKSAAAVLPPLPASDLRALEWNKYDSNYDVKARDFWKGNQIIREEVREFTKCKHEFEKTEEGAQCKKCHFGVIGIFQVEDGNLLDKGEPILFNN